MVSTERYYKVEEQGLTAPPMSPTAGGHWLTASSGCSDEWLGKEDTIAHYFLGTDWIFDTPTLGDRMFDMDVNGSPSADDALYLYDGTSWVRLTNPGICSGKLSTDFTYSGTSFATVTGWATSAEKINSGAWTWKDPADGEWEAQRDMRLCKLMATVCVTHSSGANLSTAQLKMQVDTGSGYTDIGGTFKESPIYGSGSMHGSSVTMMTMRTITAEDTFRIVAAVSQGTATHAIEADGTRVDFEEVLTV